MLFLAKKRGWIKLMGIFLSQSASYIYQIFVIRIEIGSLAWETYYCFESPVMLTRTLTQSILAMVILSIIRSFYNYFNRSVVVSIESPWLGLLLLPVPRTSGVGWLVGRFMQPWTIRPMCSLNGEIQSQTHIDKYTQRRKLSTTL